MGSPRAVSTAARKRRSVGWLRGLSGLLAGGTLLLAVALCVAWFVATRTGTGGPGPRTLAWHGGAAVIAVLGQRYADRHLDVRGTIASFAVVAVTSAVLAAQWLF